jgi:hypothetical protein
MGLPSVAILDMLLGNVTTTLKQRHTQCFFRKAERETLVVHVPVFISL